MRDVESPLGLPDSLPPPRLLDRQGWSTLIAGALLLLISFTTNYGDDNLFRFGNLPSLDKVGICLHLAALAALAGEINWHPVYDTEQKLFPSSNQAPLHRQFLAYIANALAGPPQGEQVG